jgi:hypothetical protein
MRQDTPTILEDVLSRGFDRSKRIGRDDTGRFCKGVHVRCSQCDAVVINGVAVHERTCPNEPGEDVTDAHWHDDGDDTELFMDGSAY